MVEMIICDEELIEISDMIDKMEEKIESRQKGIQDALSIICSAGIMSGDLHDNLILLSEMVKRQKVSGIVPLFLEKNSTSNQYLNLEISNTKKQYYDLKNNSTSLLDDTSGKAVNGTTEYLDFIEIHDGKIYEADR